MERREVARDSGRAESQEVKRFPAITFSIAEDEGNLPFRNELVVIQRQLDPAWRSIEPHVLSSFEEVTQGTWNDFTLINGIPVTLTATEGSKTHPRKYLQLGCREVKSRWAKKHGLLGTMRSIHSLQGSLIHELGHNFMNREDMKFMLDTFGQRFDPETADLDDKYFFNEIYAELVTHAVAERNFTEEEVSPWTERQRLGHRGVYDFLDTLSEEEKHMIIDRRHPARITDKSAEQSVTNTKLAEVRAKIGSLFQKR